MKKILIAYSSNTGNTLKLCKNTAELLKDDCHVTLKTVKETDSFEDYDLIVAAFWVDKGSANRAAKKFIDKIKNKNIAFMATLGADPNGEHADSVRDNASSLVDQSNHYHGIFLARGKIDPKLAKAAKFLPLKKELKERIYESSINSREPNEEEFRGAAQFLKNIVDKL